jgi:hypothetical protein
MSNPFGYFMVPPAQPTTSFVSRAASSVSKGVYVVLGIFVLLVILYVVYRVVSSSGSGGSSWSMGEKDQTPSPVDGTTGTTISASDIPVGDTSNYGVQYWMYIKDWNYKFGSEKGVLVRSDPTNTSIVNPKIALHPTDNSLNVSVSLYPSNASVGSSTPSASNDTSATGDSFTCTVENVPLQAWFSVSATVFQRNLDIYINGRLVKSCVLPGIPKVATGDIVVGANGGFSGSICNVHYYPRMLTPGDAMTFYSAGTSCGIPSGSSSTETGGSSFTIFGYTFRFSVKDKKGEEVRSYSF